jgi:excisionase family DNA binding protein
MRRRQDNGLAYAPEMKVLVSVDEAAALLSVGRWTIYQMIARQELPSVKLGRIRRIPMMALRVFVSEQISQAVS